MGEYRITIVDAFTERPFAGNPCAVVTRAEGLGDEDMQRIAQEMNLSETAFVFPSDRADFRVRFFTPRKEIPLAGHPTIATMHALVEEGRIAIGTGPVTVHQELLAGVLPVRIEPAEGGPRIVMTQARPMFGAELDGARIARALGIDAEEQLPGFPAQCVSTGTWQAMFPVRSLDVLKRLQPNPGALVELEAEGEYFGLHVFALEAFDPQHRAHARHFAPGAGVAEDPVTGSASGGMAAYLWHHGLLRERMYRIEQGHLLGRPGMIDVEVEADGDEAKAVRIGGRAVTVLRGTIEAPR